MPPPHLITALRLQHGMRRRADKEPLRSSALIAIQPRPRPQTVVLLPPPNCSARGPVQWYCGTPTPSPGDLHGTVALRSFGRCRHVGPRHDLPFPIHCRVRQGGPKKPSSPASAIMLGIFIVNTNDPLNFQKFFPTTIHPVRLMLCYWELSNACLNCRSSFAFRFRQYPGYPIPCRRRVARHVQCATREATAEGLGSVKEACRISTHMHRFATRILPRP